MSIGALVAEHFWLAIAFCLGGIILFIVFPALALLALIVATALFLITYSPKSG
jgi:hypothetical protein